MASSGVIGILFFAWFLYLVPIALVACPVWFLSRKRVTWTIWDFSMAAVPFCAWAIMMFGFSSAKTLSNILEAMIVGGFAAISPVARIVLNGKFNNREVALALLVLVSVGGIAVWKFVPGWPE